MFWAGPSLQRPHNRFMRNADEPMIQSIDGCKSTLEVLLRGHLWVESQLTAVLEDVLLHPEHANLARMSFANKLALVAAHGFVRDEDMSAYRVLNKLRNRSAHNLPGEPTGAEVRMLVGSLSPLVRASYEETLTLSSKSPSELSTLQLVVVLLAVRLSHEREQFARYRDSVANSNHALRTAAMRLLNAAGGPRAGSPTSQG